MLWLRRPMDKPEAALAEAVAYAEEKYGRPVRLIARPAAEKLPDAWFDPETGRAIPVRADGRVLADHLYLVMSVTQASEGDNDQ
jgi:hypothetical protein